MNKIARFTAGSSDTALSAERMNEIVDAINAFLEMRGVNGITVTISDSNIVIDGNAETTETPGPPPVNETGTLTWGGRWENIEYEIDTLVIVDEEADIENGLIAGQYVSLQAVPVDTPQPGLPGSEEFWELSARGNWTRLVFPTDVKLIDINVNGTDDLPAIDMHEDSISGAAMILIRVADALGKVIKLREVGICEDGVNRKMLVLGSLPYD